MKYFLAGITIALATIIIKSIPYSIVQEFIGKTATDSTTYLVFAGFTEEFIRAVIGAFIVQRIYRHKTITLSTFICIALVVALIFAIFEQYNNSANLLSVFSVSEILQGNHQKIALYSLLISSISLHFFIHFQLFLLSFISAYMRKFAWLFFICVSHGAINFLIALNRSVPNGDIALIINVTLKLMIFFILMVFSLFFLRFYKVATK